MVCTAFPSGRFADSFPAWAAFGLLGRLSGLLSGVCPSASGATRTPFLFAPLGFAAVCPSVRVFWGKLPPGAHGGAGNQRRQPWQGDYG